MRALLSLPPAIAFATLTASCPHPEEAFFEPRFEPAHATATRHIRAIAELAVSEADWPAPANKAADAPVDVDHDALDPGSASAWGVPTWSPDKDTAADPTLADADPGADPTADTNPDPANAKSGPVAWANAALGDVAERIAGPQGPVLVSIAKETWVYDKPHWRSRRIGYLRAGAAVGRNEDAAGFASCKAGWYAIRPRGFVCASGAATLDANHPVAALSRTRPRMDGLPYAYVLSRIPGPPMYAHVPTKAEQDKAEPDLGYHLRQAKALEHDPSFVTPPDAEAMPDALAAITAIPPLADESPRSFSELLVGRAKPRAGFALLSQFDVNGRRFGLTTQLFLVPLDRARYITGSSFHGIELGSDVTLPVAFVMKHHATHFDGAESGPRKPGAALGFREAVPLTGRSSADGQFYEAKDGSWVKAEDVRRVDPMHRAPAWAVPGRKWIDVSILNQTLVAYEGTTPEYVTLVSTGADGLGDPKKTHSTIQGTFLIHTKHVTVTMDNDEKNDEFDLRDVPFVQYFTEGYALHAAYWHDDFGTPRSHGCVNLAPIDAAWLFGYTTPEVPKGWHAAMSLKKGTLVHTHP